MRTDYPKYFISLSVLLFLTCTISCSGRPGKKNEASAVKLPEPTEAALKLIKMVSPEENSEFKLKDQIKVVLEPADREQIA